MEKIEQRAKIKISVSLIQSVMVVLDNLIKVYDQAAYSYSTVARWVASFKAGESNLEDKYRSGRQITEKNQAN